MICVTDIYVTYMSVTYMLHICHIYVWYIHCNIWEIYIQATSYYNVSLTCDMRVNILTCVYTSMIHILCVLLDFHAHRAMPQIKSFLQCSNAYMYTTHVINSNREHSEILKSFFDKLVLVDIEIYIMFKI